jgi:hypothetical protein
VRLSAGELGRSGACGFHSNDSVWLPEKVRDAAVPSVVGDEWNFASERGSIQPRVPFQAWENLSRGACRGQEKGRRRTKYADFDLTELQETRALKQAVRRNADRFPDDFIFELTVEEVALLVSQTVIPRRSKLGGAVPMAFTEWGLGMLSSVLRSDRAVQVNIEIMRAFVAPARNAANA